MGLLYKRRHFSIFKKRFNHQKSYDKRTYEISYRPKEWKTSITGVTFGKKEKVDSKVIKRLIDEGAEPRAGNNHALRWAAANGYVDIVKLLIPISNPNANNNEALKSAMENGHVEVVKLLIPVSDVKTKNNTALKWAIEEGHEEVVKLLQSAM